jgi:acyl-CoA dehydrogenase
MLILKIIILIIFCALLALLVIFCSPRIRMATFMPFILKKFRKVLPPISNTEQVAIEAGDVWWEGELFRGKPDWNLLLSLPKPKLTSEEQAFIEHQVNTLCAMIDSWAIFKQGEIPKEILQYLQREKFFGLAMSKEQGGLGFSAFAHSCIITQIASRNTSVAVTVMVPNSLGPAEFIHHYGTLEQKQYYLPRLASGEEIPAFGLTAPNAGSDATSIKDSGVVCKGLYEGKEVLGIRLNWDKRYITLAPIATLLVIAFKLYDPDHLLGEKKKLGICLALVPTQLPGVEQGSRHLPMNLVFLNGPVRGHDVFVPLDFILGGAENIGNGWRMMMDALAVGRGISLPALSTGVSKLCFRMSGAYARVREQFNSPIGEFEGVQEVLARMGANTYFCEAVRRLTTTGIDLGVRPALVTAITKYHLTELSRTVVNDAMDVHAGRGIQYGPHNYLGLLYQSAPVGITVEGANILTRNLIIFGQGAVRCHPYVRGEIAAANDPDQNKGLINFDHLFARHIAYVLSNLGRTFIYGLTGGHLISFPKKKHKQTTRYYQQLTRMSTALALTADIVMLTLGGKLKRKESISARLGDILSQLYLGSAVLKYFNDYDQPTEDLPFVHWCLSQCLYQIQIAFDGVFSNFPKAWLASLLRFLIFPWGRAYTKPADHWGHEIAKAMMQATPFRDRITAFCYVGKDNEDATGLMENAFRAVCEAQVIKDKLHQAEKSKSQAAAILTENEVEFLKAAENLRNKAIQVDEFK